MFLVKSFVVPNPPNLSQRAALLQSVSGNWEEIGAWLNTEMEELEGRAAFGDPSTSAAWFGGWARASAYRGLNFQISSERARPAIRISDFLASSCFECPET
jgi:hypothetical protein